MSEWVPVVGLILGAIGTVTGIVSMYIHWKRFQMEKPKVTVELIDCDHKFVSEEERKRGMHWKIELAPKFRITNVGDRGTTFSKYEVSFKINADQYSGSQDNPVYHKKVEEHSTVDIKPFIYSYSGGRA